MKKTVEKYITNLFIIKCNGELKHGNGTENKNKSTYQTINEKSIDIAIERDDITRRLYNGLHKVKKQC